MIKRNKIITIRQKGYQKYRQQNVNVSFSSSSAFYPKQVQSFKTASPSSPVYCQLLRLFPALSDCFFKISSTVLLIQDALSQPLRFQPWTLIQRRACDVAFIVWIACIRCDPPTSTFSVHFPVHLFSGLTITTQLLFSLCQITRLLFRILAQTCLDKQF